MNATMHDPAIPERKRMEKFLPWYIAGRLTRDDRIEVEAYLRSHPDFAPNVERVKSEHDELVQLYESLGAPKGGALARLMTSIDAEGVRRIQPETPKGIVSRVGAWFKDLTPRQLALAASVALAVFVVQAAAITMLATKGRVHPAETAQTRPLPQPQTTAQAPRLPTLAPPTQPSATATLARDARVTGGSYLTVTFADSAKAPEIAAFLSRYGASVAEVKDGKYRIKLLDVSATTAATQGPPRDLVAVATQMRSEQSLVRGVEVMK